MVRLKKLARYGLVDDKEQAVFDSKGSLHINFVQRISNARLLGVHYYLVYIYISRNVVAVYVTGLWLARQLQKNKIQNKIDDRNNDSQSSNIIVMMI